MLEDKYYTTTLFFPQVSSPAYHGYLTTYNKHPGYQGMSFGVSSGKALRTLEIMEP